MSSVALWRATQSLATAWREGSKILEHFSKELPRNAPQRSSGLPGYLQELNASGAHINSHPLRSFLFVQMAQANPLPAIASPPPEENGLADWLQLAERVEAAHRLTVGWLRSRLPGYPNLLVPHLVQGSPLTTEEFTWRLAWPRSELTKGLQTMPAPPNVAAALGLDRTGARVIDGTARALAAALVATREFEVLSDARGALDTEAKQMLSATNSRLRGALSPGEIDSFEPRRALRRADYRQERLTEAIATLDGPALAYALAFGAAEELVELATADVFGQLAAYGEIPIRFASDSLDLNDGPRGLRQVTFGGSEDDWWETGELVWIEDSLVQDAIRVTAISFSFTQAGGVEQKITADILPSTAEAWRTESPL